MLFEIFSNYKCDWSLTVLTMCLAGYDAYICSLTVHAKFNLASGVCVDLKDSSGVDVDADIFDELLRSATISFKVVTEHFGKT